MLDVECREMRVIEKISARIMYLFLSRAFGRRLFISVLCATHERSHLTFFVDLRGGKKTIDGVGRFFSCCAFVRVCLLACVRAFFMFFRSPPT